MTAIVKWARLKHAVEVDGDMRSTLREEHGQMTRDELGWIVFGEIRIPPDNVLCVKMIEVFEAKQAAGKGYGNAKNK